MEKIAPIRKTCAKVNKKKKEREIKMKETEIMSREATFRKKGN